MKKRFYKYLILPLALGLISTSTFAQIVDTTFSTDVGFNDAIMIVAEQTDQKLLVGGYFTEPSSSIERLLPTGSVDTSFHQGSGFNGAVKAIAIQPDQKLIIGGEFTDYDGHPCNYIVRLNSDGSIDPTFNIGTGFNTIVQGIEFLPDGKIIVGGNFSSFNGIAAEGIVKLNSDGSVDANFQATIGGQLPWVIALKSLPNDQILVAGLFDTVNGQNINDLVRLNSDGSIDMTFNVGLGINGAVACFNTLDDNKILVGGNITTFNGTPCSNLVRLNPEGTIDTGFDIEANFYVGAITPLATGKIMIGGNFTTINGISSPKIARLNSDGSHDLSFDPGAGPSSYAIRSILEVGDKIMVGGEEFLTFDGVPTHNIVRLFQFFASARVDGNVITANSGDSYTWIDCTTGQVISGENNQTFEPTESGFYQVIVTEGDFIDTSNCVEVTVLGLNETSVINTVSVYPNPSTSHVEIRLFEPLTEETQLSVINPIGEIVYHRPIFNGTSSFIIDLDDLASGVYQLQLLNTKQVWRTSLVLE